MSGSVQTLAGMFHTTDFLIPLVLGDLTEAQARTRSRGDAGPSIAWTVGHMLDRRIQVLNLLGAEETSPWSERFGAAPATDGSDYPTLGELRTAWDEVAGSLHAALDGTTEERLGRPVEAGPHAEKSLRDRVVFLAWHEAYHLGALGALRKALGLGGPAEKVMALQEAGAS